MNTEQLPPLAVGCLPHVWGVWRDWVSGLLFDLERAARKPWAHLGVTQDQRARRAVKRVGQVGLKPTACIHLSARSQRGRYRKVDTVGCKSTLTSATPVKGHEPG